MELKKKNLVSKYFLNGNELIQDIGRTTYGIFQSFKANNSKYYLYDNIDV